MRSIFGLFGKSPFDDFKTHMNKIAECVEALDPVFEALYAGDRAALKAAAKKVSQLEHAADLIKNEMRNNMPRSLFMPVDRRDLLDVLSTQDTICDGAEDIAVILTLRALTVPPFMQEQVKKLVQSVRVVFDKAVEVVHQFDLLLKATFSGPEREKVLSMIDELSKLEHLADKEQDKLLKLFFQHEDDFKPAEIYLWLELIDQIGDLANDSERMANRVRLVLAS